MLLTLKRHPMSERTEKVVRLLKSKRPLTAKDLEVILKEAGVVVVFTAQQ